MTSPRAEFLDLYRAGVNSAVDLMYEDLPRKPGEDPR